MVCWNVQGTVKVLDGLKDTRNWWSWVIYWIESWMLFDMCTVWIVLLINKYIAGKNANKYIAYECLSGRNWIKGDVEPQVRGVCLRGFSCRSESCLKEASLKEAAQRQRRDTFNRLGQLLSHIFSMKEWVEARKLEGRKKRKKETGPSVFILKGKVNKQEELGGETWYTIYSISGRQWLKNEMVQYQKWCNYDVASFERKCYLCDLSSATQENFLQW